MKNAFKILFAAIAMISLSSCCNFAKWGGQKVDSVQTKSVERVVEVVGPKGGVTHTTVVEEVEVESCNNRVACQKCMTTFCPTPECCGSTSQVVIARATTNPGNGNPHMGLIPTMRKLNE